MCKDGAGWDDPLPDELITRWVQWRNEVVEQAALKIPRCYKSTQLGNVIRTELHHFSDASTNGYGQCSYVRMIDAEGHIDTALVMAKSRVTPSKAVTIPRLELTAAVTSVRVGSFLSTELRYNDVEHVYWTDSNVVLGYINNESRRFHVFVANRVQEIRNHTSPNQWRYIDTTINPADIASRGATAKDLMMNELWWKGPAFLMSREPLPSSPVPELPTDHCELKKATVLTTRVKCEPNTDWLLILNKFSSWIKAKKAIAVCLRLKSMMIGRMVKKPTHCMKVKAALKHYRPVNVMELQKAEVAILSLLQKSAFPSEVITLRKNLSRRHMNKNGKGEGSECVKQNSSLIRLDPFMDVDGLLHVGGRLRRSHMTKLEIHPVILPSKSHVTQLIVLQGHKETAHSGRGLTLGAIRAAGYWIMSGRSAVSRYIWNCITCRRLRGPLLSQKMADLPADRVEQSEPFTYSGVDFFGPLYVKIRRGHEKRYGALFTCLCTRAVHIEIAHNMTTDSFINAYRRFVARRGACRELRSDRGTNFVGVEGELKTALAEMDDGKITQELLSSNCDWIAFQMNVPHASHMGGVWERQIRTVRNVLTALMIGNETQLDDELLLTLMAEVEAIVNSRPLTCVRTTEADDPEPLSPSQILTLKSTTVMPPPGKFVKEDMFCRRRWRRVQYLANQFWSRWRKEFLPTLQTRGKWTAPQRSLCIDDVVLMMDDALPRCNWPMARVTATYPGEDGLVRKVQVTTKDSSYDRPVHKLVLLMAQGSPVEEPFN